MNEFIMGLFFPTKKKNISKQSSLVFTAEHDERLFDENDKIEGGLSNLPTQGQRRGAQ